MDLEYKSKYLLYKSKYLNLKKLLGGGKEITFFYVNDTSKEFMSLVVDESDDINYVKLKIKEQINNPKINEDNIVLYEMLADKKVCKIIALTTVIPSKVTHICVELKKSYDIASSIPIDIKTEVEKPAPFQDETIQAHLSVMELGPIPRPNIELLRPRIMKAVKELEDSGQSFINYELDESLQLYPDSSSGFVNPFELSTVPVEFPDNLSDSSLPPTEAFPFFGKKSDIPLGSVPPPPGPPPRLEGTKIAQKNERNELLDIISNGKPYEIFDVRLDVSRKEHKLWLKNKNNDLIEIYATTQGKIKSIQNKGPIMRYNSDI